MSNLDLHRQYELARALAELEATRYENQMLWQLVHALTLNNTDQGQFRRVTKRREEPVVFTRDDFVNLRNNDCFADLVQDESDANDHFYEEFDDNVYDEENYEDDYEYDEDVGYYDELGVFHYYEDDEQYEELGENAIVEAFELATRGVGEGTVAQIAAEPNEEETSSRSERSEQQLEAISSITTKRTESSAKSDKDKNSKTSEDPSASIGVDFELQSEEMSKLYGPEGAEAVLGAEARLQMRFDQLCDQHRPNIWPCLPLNFKFDF